MIIFVWISISEMRDRYEIDEGFVKGKPFKEAVKTGLFVITALTVAFVGLIGILYFGGIVLMGLLGGIAWVLNNMP